MVTPSPGQPKRQACNTHLPQSAVTKCSINRGNAAWPRASSVSQQSSSTNSPSCHKTLKALLHTCTPAPGTIPASLCTQGPSPPSTIQAQPVQGHHKHTPATKSSKRSTTPGRLRWGLAKGEMSTGWSSTKVGCCRRGSTTASNTCGRRKQVGSVMCQAGTSHDPGSSKFASRAPGSRENWVATTAGWAVQHSTSASDSTLWQCLL